jgi:hypothetical protein
MIRIPIKMSNFTKWENYPTWNYKKTQMVKYSAGILPYTFDREGKCFFLLGKDNENDWSDFGGRCEFRDKSEPLNTATREFYEETLGAVHSVQECMDKLHMNPTRIVSKTLNGSPYYMYLMYIENHNYNDTFIKTSNFLKYSYYQDKRMLYRLIEKNSIRWVSMDTILNCIENGQRNAPISLRGVFYNTLVLSKDQLQFLIK